MPMPQRLVSAVEPTRHCGTNSKGWEAIGRAVLEGAGQGCRRRAGSGPLIWSLPFDSGFGRPSDSIFGMVGFGCRANLVEIGTAHWCTFGS